jgi:hypothetical protein
MAASRRTQKCGSRAPAGMVREERKRGRDGSASQMSVDVQPEDVRYFAVVGEDVELARGTI